MFRRNKKKEFVEENSKRKFLYHKELAKKVKHLKLLIVDLVQDLLSSSNPVSVQVNGMRIFLLWYQILGENAIVECTDLFIRLVPDFGSVHDTYKSQKNKSSSPTLVSCDGDCQKSNRNMAFYPRMDSMPPAASAPISDERKNYILLRYLLRFAVTEVDKIQWNSSAFDRRPMCFWFIFEQLKRYYFPAIFPKISVKHSLYYGGVLPAMIKNPLDYSLAPEGYTLSATRLAIYQEEVVRWLSEFLYTGPRAFLPSLRPSSSTGDLRNQTASDGVGLRNPHSSEGSTSGIDLTSQSDQQRPNINVQDHRTTTPPADVPLSCSCSETSPQQQSSQISSSLVLSGQRQQRRSSAAFKNLLSIMEIRQTTPGYFAEHSVMASQRTVFLEPVLPILPEWSSEYSSKMIERVRDILFYSRQNINLIHAVFYHASLLPIDRYKALFCLILVYRSWLKDKIVFVKDADTKHVPSKSAIQPNCGPGSNLKDMRRRREVIQSTVLSNRSLSKLPNNSPAPSTQHSLPFPHNDVGGCLQTTYQVMFTNLAHIFLRVCPPACVVTLELTDRVQETPVDFVVQQIALCTLILDTIVQPLTQSNALSTESWEKLLFTLMHIISEVMSKIYQTDQFDSHWVSNDKLLGKMFQTLNTACIYATLAAPISSSTWDTCLSIYSKLPDCPALFREWKATMDFLTRQLGKIVFDVDLANLPDETKTNRGRRALGKLGAASQCMGPSRIAPRERRNSADVNAVGSVMSGLPDIKLPSKAFDLEESASNEVTSAVVGQETPAVEFSLTSSSDDAEAVSSDKAAECLSPAEGIGIAYHESSNFSDGGSSDVDYYPQKHHIFVPWTETQMNEADVKDNDGVALPSSGTSNNGNGKLMNQTQFYYMENRTLDNAYESENVIQTALTRSNDLRTVRPQTKTRNAQLDDVWQGQHFSENLPFTKTLTRVSNSEMSSRASTLKKPTPQCLKGNSVLAGGKEMGWNPDSAVVCWRRFLGLLGDFSHFSSPTVMVDVFAYLDSLTDSLLAIDAYQPLELLSDGTVKAPTNRPPIDYLVPVYLKVLQMSPEFIEGKKLAIGILKKILIAQHDLEPSEELLAQFYRILHHLLTQKESNFASEVIRSDCGKIFSYSLSGCGLLTLDFIQAVDEILCQPSSEDETLRTRAMSILVALLPFQHHFGPLKVFDPALRELKVKETDDIIPFLAAQLFRGVVAEANEGARQVAICGLLMMCYSNLTRQSVLRFASAEKATSLRTCLVTLLRCTRLTNRAVALTAMSMLRTLTECSETIFDINPTYPILIIQATLDHKHINLDGMDSENTNAAFDFTAEGGGQEWSKEVTCLWVVFSVLEFICSSSATSVQLEPAGPGWVPGCPISDPLADEVTPWFPYQLLSVEQKKKFTDELRPTVGGGERHSHLVEGVFSDQSYFLTPAPLTPESIRMAARFARCQLFCQLGRYPLSSTNDILDSRVQEHHDRKTTVSNADEELTFESFDQPDVQIFVVNRSFLVSIFTVTSSPDKSNNWASGTGHAVNTEAFREDVATDLCNVRVIVRDVVGKYAWDATHIYGLMPKTQKRAPSPPPRQRALSINLEAIEPNGDEQNTKAKVDFLTKLLEGLILQHPELRSQIPLENTIAVGAANTSSCVANPAFEKWAFQRISAAIKNEKRILGRNTENLSLPFYGNGAEETMETTEMEQWSKLNQKYNVIKQLLCQLGFLSQSRRPSIELLKKSWGLVREIKNLDKRRSRQTHKIALVYIGPGQEEKQDILSNLRGSIEFQRFVSNLGWPINLANHQGFTGGLQYPEDGDIATYFASPAVEVIFHVSTHMPSATDEDRHRMFKHLGNDEVMIIWTEHWRSFRRSSLRTEFGDVLIIISPLSSGLFRIEIRKESEIPFFGPLIDGMLVSEEHLPFLVRSTAIQASNAINTRKPNFKEHFEERYFYLQSIISSHMQNTTFEDFVMQVASPRPLLGQENSDRGPAAVAPWFPVHLDVDSVRLPSIPQKDVSPLVRMRRRVLNCSESVSGVEDFIAPASASEDSSRINSLNSPNEGELSLTEAAPCTLSNTSTALTPSDAPQQVTSMKEQPRTSFFNRISLRHKRRNAGAQGRRASASRLFNTNNH
ncbi:Ral GTPase-activating protein subunit alpha-1 [Echinococcus granulosus]|uniref:Ral GTPase-activating protein subunit alpha-1 n=1 Tax=Echinococcus granulosus TaxID=6210 RepID=W6URG7_ECHGR|nr:Ral GTPase-activating protein subunit alpha-1 [Echinococcus granulosus]EUB63833.1 Ral GTPase-activating protein subunit alpha-1 [Echinococcus granulosus]